MRKFHKTSVLLLSLLCLRVLSGCAQPEQVEYTTESNASVQTESTAPAVDYSVEELTTVVAAGDIYKLNAYTNLKKLDLSGSTCYEAIAQYAAEHPQTQVLYTVELGGTTVGSQETKLTLQPGSFDYGVLLENLPYLPNLKELSFPKTTLDGAEISFLQETFPDLTITYTNQLLGVEYSADTKTLDLSALTPEQTDEAAAALGRFTELEFVELMGANGSNLAISDVRKLVEAAPEAIFHYTFTLFGREISTNDETVTYKNQKIGNEGEAELRDALSIMTGCQTFTLDNCGFDSEVLAEIRSDYPRTKLVWRIYFGKYNALTNTEKIRAVYNVFDTTCSELRYCQDVKYMDIGHNESLTDLSFVGYMPNLEILIASGCAVTDLSGFENCKKLEFLELAYCYKLEDISPLAGCESLANLNISYSKVYDLSPLDGLPLEQLCSKKTKVMPMEQEAFRDIHPDCVASFTGSQPYGKGWRYTDNGYHFTEIYQKVRDVFGYDQIDKLLDVD